MVLIVRLPCHCLSLTLHILSILVLFYFGQFKKALSNFKEEHNIMMSFPLNLTCSQTLVSMLASFATHFCGITVGA